MWEQHIRLAVDVYTGIFYFEDIAGQANATFDIIFFFIDRAGDDGELVEDGIPAIAAAGLVIVELGMLGHNGIATGVIEYNNIITLDVTKTGDAVIFPLNGFGIGLSAGEWHCVVDQRHGNGCHGYAGAISQFADEQVIIHQHGAFHGAGRYGISLEKEKAYEGSGYDGK